MGLFRPVCLIFAAQLVAPTAASQEAGRGQAPIVYATGAFRPTANTEPDALASDTRSISQPGSSGAIDLRPGGLRAAPSSIMDAKPRDTVTGFAEPVAGPPYQAAGKWYVPTHEPFYDEIGIASWYGPSFDGKPAASGEVFEEYAMTAAHPTLPIPSIAEVTSLATGKTITVRINDRGPFVGERIIDLSRAAAAALDLTRDGTGRVRVRYLGPAPADPDTPISQVVASPSPLADRTATDATVATSPTSPVSPATPSGTANDLSVDRTSGAIAGNMPREVRSEAALLSGYRPAADTPAVREDADLAGIYIQAGSFADLGNAHTLKSSLQGLGPTFITTVTVNGAEFYRVM